MESQDTAKCKTLCVACTHRQSCNKSQPRRGVHFNDNLCNMCSAKPESISHLFFECEFAHQVWSGYEKWLGISSVIHNKSKEDFNHFETIFFNSRQILFGKGCGL